jgi:hypothetical protein
MTLTKRLRHIVAHIRRWIAGDGTPKAPPEDRSRNMVEYLSAIRGTGPRIIHDENCERLNGGVCNCEIVVRTGPVVEHLLNQKAG